MLPRLVRIGCVGVLVYAGVATAGACGGSTANDVFGTSGASADAATASDAAASGDAAGARDGATGQRDAALDARVDGAGASCEVLLAQVEATRPQAIECIASSVEQCDQLVDDVCCKATLSKVQKGTPAVKAFQSAVAAFKSAKCAANCPAAPCSTEPSFSCVEDGIGASCEQ